MKNNSIYKIKAYQKLGFIGLLIALFFFLGLYVVFFAWPEGYHFLRQTDSLSFASNYYNDGFNFFAPKLYNLKNIDGRAVCEFPITYYITALSYTVFGKQIFILRIIHLLIIYMGVYYIFKLSMLVLKDFLYSLIIALFLFTSTIFNYYSFNYLPDIAALGFAFAGWYFIYKYSLDFRNKTAFIAFLFFTLGGLIKVTYMINPLAVIFVYILSYFTVYREIKNKKIIKYGIFSVLIVILWNVYVLYYNSKYQSNSFNTTILPIWDLDKAGIKEVFNYMWKYWYSKYFAYSSFHLLAVLIALQLVFIKRVNKRFAFALLIMLFASISYFLLFYQQFKEHDYYFLAFMPFIILIVINGIYTLDKLIKKAVFKWIIKIGLLVLVIAGINYSRLKIAERYTPWDDEYSKSALVIRDNIDDINKLKIPKEAKLIIATDLTQNGALFFIDRMGWVIRKKEDITQDNILNYKKKGADYLVLINPEKEQLNTAKEFGTIVLNKADLKILKLEK